MPRTIVLAAVAVALSACSERPTLFIGKDPSDPSVVVRSVSYIPVTAGTLDHRPVAPRPWLERNQDVAPGARGGQ